MPKLNQVLAIEKGVKDRTHALLTSAHHTKQPLLDGLARTYVRVNEDGAQFPPENQRVQVRLQEVLAETQRGLQDLFDVTAQRDYANCQAKADVVLDTGEVVLRDVPAVYLLWLEKRLVDLHTFVSALPTLSPGEEWTFDATQNCYRSDVLKTAKTAKVAKAFVKYEATKEHPAQVDVVHEDVLQGYWHTTKYSGALPATSVQAMRQRVEKLQAAVKFAREQANLQDAPKVKVGEVLLGYLFGQ